MKTKYSKKEILEHEPTPDEIDREPLDFEEPDDPMREHDDREWQIAIDNRIE